MIIWFIFSTVSLLLAYLSQKNILPIAYKPAKVFLVIWLSGFVNFGGKGMVDQLNYVKAYQNFNDASVLNVFTWVNLHIEALSNSRESIEIGYQVFGTVFNLLGFGFVGFSFFYGLLLNTLMLKFIYRYKYPVLSILILIATTVYSQQANLMRQMMAVAFFLYATKFIFTKSVISYFFYVFIGSLFHASALPLMILYFFANSNLPTYILLSVWTISVILNFVGDNIPIFQLIRAFEVIYYDVNLDKTDAIGNDTGFNFLMNIVFGLVLLFKTPKIESNDPYNLLVNIYFIGVVVLNLVVVSDWFFRISLYFTPIYIVLLPYLIESIKKSRLQKIISLEAIGSLLWIPILYYLFLIFSYSFRELNSTMIGSQMYGYSDLWN